MAEPLPEKKTGFFHYTQGKAWGGSQIDPVVFKIITVLFGFFGLDHLLLRSPITAILKFLVNIISLGFWYWYDILQVFTDFDNFKKYGYSLPIFGPAGLGAGLVHDTGTPKAPIESPSPFYFVAFALTSLIPYGLSHVIAGDYLGAFLKFILSVSFFTFLFGWLWAAYTFGNMMLNSKSLFENGTDRLFPLSFFFGQYGPGPRIQPHKPQIPEEKEPDCPPGFLDILWSYILLLPKTLYDILFPPVKKAVEVTIETGKKIVDETKKIVDETKKVVEPPVKEVTKIATEMPKVLSNTVNELGQYTDPAKLSELAEKQAIQTGGAVLALEGPSIFNVAVVGVLLLTIVGGLALTYVRINMAKSEVTKEKNDVPPAVQHKDRDDTPPGP